MSDVHGPVDVLVTGSSGFVGSALAARLQREGATVAGLDVTPGQVPTVSVDITDGGQVRAAFERLRPRRVVHTAAIVDDRGDPKLFQAVNVTGTDHIVAACEACDVERLVHVSSIVVLGLDSPAQCDERTPLQPYTGAAYMDTKAVSERRVRDAWAAGRVPAVVVRPGDVYGLGSQPWVQRPLEMMRQGMPLLVGSGHGLMVHCWIDNLIDGLLLCLEKPDIDGRVFHITDGVDGTTFREYFERLAVAGRVNLSPWSLPGGVATRLGAALDRASRWLPFTPPFGETAARYLLRRSSYSIKGAREALGYEPAVDLAEGMARMARDL
ncbi:MAG: NAD-dependent epimerase/dehydratase family protein [Myxococcota bacterium]